MSKKSKCVEPTIGEQYAALIDTTPGMALLLVISFTFAIGRFVYVVGFLGSASALEAIGLFSPWFLPWGVMLVSGVFIGVQFY